MSARVSSKGAFASLGEKFAAENENMVLWSYWANGKEVKGVA